MRKAIKPLSEQQLIQRIDNLLADGRSVMRRLKSIRLKKAMLDFRGSDFRALSEEEAEIERYLEDTQADLDALRASLDALRARANGKV